MIVVQPVDKPFKIRVKAGKDEVVFTCRQLDYHTNSLIVSESVRMQQGTNNIDFAKKAFLALKYALVEVTGMTNPDGSDYKLKKEAHPERPESQVLTDECLNELLSTPISDKLIFTGSQLGNVVPKEIVDPISGKKVQGVDIVVETAGVKKK